MNTWETTLCLLMTLTTVNSQSLQSNRYVWYDFSQRIPIQYYSQQFSVLQLPCQTRIGSCQMQFTIIPPNWRVEDGKLIIPKSDSQSILSFFVQMIGSDETGEKSKFDVILDINSGVVTSKKGNPPPHVNSSLNPKKIFPQFSPQIQLPIVPGFPTGQQIRLVLEEGDIIQISNLLSEIITREGECQLKKKYLIQLQKIIRDQIQLNEAQSYGSSEKISELENELKYLKHQLQKIKSDIESNKENFGLQKELESKKKQSEEGKKKYKKYRTLFNLYLKRLTEINHIHENASDQEMAYNSMKRNQVELNEANEEIKKVFERKASLQENIILRKTLLYIGKNRGQQKRIGQMEAVYKQYSNLANKEKEKLEEIERQIESLIIQKDQKQDGDKFEKLQEKILEKKEGLQKVYKEQEEKVEELVQMKETLEINSDGVESRINSDEKKCKSSSV